MKTFSTLLSGFLFSVFLIFNCQAQDVGNLLASVADGIKPEAFKGSWDKTGEQWKEKAADLDASDVSGVSESVGTLLGNLKGSAFLSGAKKNIMKQLGSMGSIADLKGLFSSLVSGLNPSMLKPEFLSKKDTLMKGLEMIN